MIENWSWSLRDSQNELKDIFLYCKRYLKGYLFVHLKLLILLNKMNLEGEMIIFYTFLDSTW